MSDEKYQRDPNSGAAVNVDQAGLEAYKRAKRDAEKLRSLEERIQRIEDILHMHFVHK